MKFCIHTSEAFLQGYNLKSLPLTCSNKFYSNFCSNPGETHHKHVRKMSLFINFSSPKIMHILRTLIRNNRYFFSNISHFFGKKFRFYEAWYQICILIWCTMLKKCYWFSIIRFLNRISSLILLSEEYCILFLFSFLQTDVLGTCDTTYKSAEQSPEKYEILKTINIPSCSNHLKGQTLLLATLYQSSAVR